MHEGLKRELSAHANVGHISGIGLFAGLEFVASRAGKVPFDRSKKIAEKFVSYAFEQGLIVWPNIGQVDGINGDLIMLGPPLTCSAAQIDELVLLVSKCVTGFFSGLK